MVVHIRVLLAAEMVNMMTLREAQIFFFSAEDGGARCGRRGHEQGLGKSSLTPTSTTMELKIFTNIFRKEAKQSLHLFRCSAFFFSLSHDRNSHTSPPLDRNSACISDLRAGAGR